jgi:hypothetical protein
LEIEDKRFKRNIERAREARRAEYVGLESRQEVRNAKLQKKKEEEAQKEEQRKAKKAEKCIVKDAKKTSHVKPAEPIPWDETSDSHGEGVGVFEIGM